MRNLFGSITWPKTYTNFHEFSINVASDELEDISDYNSTEMDSLTDSFTINDTTYNLGSRNTNYPGKIVLSGSYKISNIFAYFFGHISSIFNYQLQICKQQQERRGN